MKDKRAIDSSDHGDCVEFLSQARARTINRLRRFVGDHAEDVFQDAAVNAWRNWENWDGRASRATWFWAIVRNAALSTLRARQSRPEGHPVQDSQEVLDALCGGSEDQRIRVLDLHREVGRLPALYRTETVWQWEGYGAGQDNTRKVTWHRAKLKLRGRLSEPAKRSWAGRNRTEHNGYSDLSVADGQRWRDGRNVAQPH